MKKLSLLLCALMLALSGCDTEAPPLSEEPAPPIDVEVGSSIEPEPVPEATPPEPAPTETPKTVTPEAPTQESGDQLEDLLRYFPTDSYERVYNGYAEYGHAITCRGSVEDKEYGSLLITYDGEIRDGYGEDERGPRSFTVAYEIRDGRVTENVLNLDYTVEKQDTLNSIIPGFVALDGEIARGSFWEQEFTYKGEAYTAVTTIIEAEDGMFTTDTIALGVDGFDVYREIRRYEAGKGLTAFSSSFESDEIIDFGYGYSGYTDPSTGELVSG